MLHAGRYLIPLALATLMALPAGCRKDSEEELLNTVEADVELGEKEENYRRAQAELESKSGSEVEGSVTFTQQEGEVVVDINLSGLTPGKHGFHVHEKGDCSADDASSAGGHFAPLGNSHGSPDADEHHVGDLGNVVADEDGNVQVQKRFDSITLEDGAKTSILGKAVVVHSGEDDFESQPSGAAGKRVACGVVAQKL